jgi:hypothetical protein
MCSKSMSAALMFPVLPSPSMRMKNVVEFGRDLEVVVIPKSYPHVVKLRNESII